VELIVGGADVHCLWDRGYIHPQSLDEDDDMLTKEMAKKREPKDDGELQTPLLSLFEGFSESRYWYPKKSLPQRPQELLEMWLKLLQDSGVDLLKYGRKETKIHASESIQEKYLLYLWPSKGYMYDAEDLVFDGFTYGRSVDDWRLPDQDLVARSLGEFWEMVEIETRIWETRQKAMPGAWVF
jgi:hypothetical protein